MPSYIFVTINHFEHLTLPFVQQLGSVTYILKFVGLFMRKSFKKGDRCVVS